MVDFEISLQNQIHGEQAHQSGLSRFVESIAKNYVIVVVGNHIVKVEPYFGIKAVLSDHLSSVNFQITWEMRFVSFCVWNRVPFDIRVIKGTINLNVLVYRSRLIKFEHLNLLVRSSILWLLDVEFNSQRIALRIARDIQFGFFALVFRAPI